MIFFRRLPCQRKFGLASPAPSPAEPPLLLASTSRWRRELLERLYSGFGCVSPEVDERPGATETPAALAGRLARAKAQRVHDAHPHALVIGADQVAELDGRALGKPGSKAGAVAQLLACSGRTVLFHTAVQLLGPYTDAAHTDLTRVRFRRLDERTVRRYVDLERPLDCAGSFRCEGAGIALFEAIETGDPTALIGLPLIWLSGALARAGRPAF